jgi:hypothetical protein
VPTGPVKAPPPDQEPRIPDQPATPAVTPNSVPDAKPAGTELAEGKSAEAEPAKTAPTKAARSAPAKKAAPAKATPAKATPAKAARKSARPAPAKAQPAAADTANAQPPKAQPAKAQPENAEPASVQLESTQPAKAQPAKAQPAKAQPAEVRPAGVAAASRVAPPPALPEIELDRADVAVSTPQAPAERVVSASAGAESAVECTPQRTEAWAQLVADPGHAPELLALAAVQAIGPAAKEWARRTREAYPTATSDGLARLAVRQFTRFGTVGSILGAVAGSYAPVALLGTAALTHAELVLHVAAAYGLDPSDEQRAADLLVLTRVHPSRADAEAAIAAAKQPAYEDDSKLSDAAWRFGRMATTQAGGWLALRLVNRLFPGTSLLVAALASRSAAESVGSRATRFYSQESQSLGSRV